jgi:hypothetical protein
MSEREAFRVEGVGCWCDGNITLDTLRIMGHTKECTEARRGWKRNYENLAEIAQQRRVDQEVGRQVREAAIAQVLSEDASGE